MARLRGVFPLFVVLVVCALLIFFAARNGLLRGATGLVQRVTVPVQRVLFDVAQKAASQQENSTLQKLRDENLTLIQQLVQMKQLQQDNQALRDQFQNTTPAANSLVPAHIIGMNGFLPGVSQPDSLLIDQGSDSGIKRNEVVIVKNNLLGMISDVSSEESKVTLLTASATAFTARTLKTGAMGIVRVQNDGTLTFDNVVLSDKLRRGDLVITNGDITNQTDIPQNLIVGKVTSVDRQTSSLFQTAQIQSLVAITRLSLVFVEIGK